MPRPFLTARWEHLPMLNFAIDPALLAPNFLRVRSLISTKVARLSASWRSSFATRACVVGPFHSGARVCAGAL